ncbi:hypothetical protein NQZ68_033854 [Dissostichus eleginoides]|nr:hypothetical protein NQZ68_033854 [Dissostichus eleginoides]
MRPHLLTQPDGMEEPLKESWEDTPKVRPAAPLNAEKPLDAPSHADWITAMHFPWPRSQIDGRLQLIQMQQFTSALEKESEDIPPL